MTLDPVYKPCQTAACVLCGATVHTCELDDEGVPTCGHVDHAAGARLIDGWVCSRECWEAATADDELGEVFA